MQGAPGWACVTAGGDAADIAHEASHALGLNHSWGGTPTKEYGDYYSITGYTAGGGYQYTDTVGSRWGPGYAAPDLVNLGYLPPSQVSAVGWPAIGTRYTFTLTALSHYLDGGFLMARIASGLGGGYLSIEYRTKDGPDAGIPGSRVVIHQVGSIVDQRAAVFVGDTTTVNGLSIKTYPASGNRATVTVQATFPNTIYNIPSNGDLTCNRHLGYISGDRSWGNPTKVGNGWQNFKQVFSVSGSIYGLLPDGRLLWYRHNGTDTCSQDWNPAGGTVVKTIPNVKFIFGMPTEETPGGTIYVVKTDGRLLWFRHNGWATGAKVWEGPVQVGYGWQHFTKVIPGAEGVIYAVDTDGNLWWYRHLGYKTGENTWQGWRNLVGTGWNGFYKLVGGSPDGVIYGVWPSGEVWWYRHLGWLTGTEDWDPYGMTIVRYGWSWQKQIFQRTWTPTRPIG
jgi:hypothetical protein